MVADNTKAGAIGCHYDKVWARSVEPTFRVVFEQDRGRPHGEIPWGAGGRKLAAPLTPP